ncbi:hypothetical protein F7725_008107 [Dissostichus mawsoni]|uniref:Protein kinase domain-containing protein n=1 Tax=Dissostichus mawsoni TaxID=36200 RepID=A0A7J5Y684_DISMA|nr:hypothetical protein F7725_008107 [Dissostichus mawsoni]
MLDMSIWDLSSQMQEPFSLNEIRPITQQLLVAFEALKGIGIIHTDLKPDNVMLVNHKSQPFRIKLIDFGLALPASKAELVNGLTPGWELMTPSQYKMVSGVQPEFPSLYFDDVKDLTVAVMEKTEEHDYDTSEDKITLSEVMCEDKMAFLDLLNRLLNLDGQTRITPGQALEHGFVTMFHLEDNMHSNPHASEAFKMMDICTRDLSDAMCDPLSDPSENGETDIGVT